MKIVTLLTTFFALIAISKAEVCNQKQKWGANCKSCKERVFCAQILEEWKDISLDRCGDGFVCDDGTGECVESNAKCYDNAKGKVFECAMEGVFPDPFGCDHYYVCTLYNNAARGATITSLQTNSRAWALMSIKAQCQDGKLYSAKTQSCSLDETDNTCIQPLCRIPGEASAWPENDNLYYVCALNENNELYPIMLRCAPNEKFNGNHCVEKCSGSDATTSSSPNPSKSSVGSTVPIEPTPTQTSSTATTKPIESLSCTKQGIKPHPVDCTKYYYCDSKLTPLIYDCPDGSYFNSSFGLCVKGAC